MDTETGIRHETALTTEKMNIRSRRRVLGAAVSGTSLEFYDFFIYGTAASLVFPHLFFPGSDPTAGLLLALATYAVGYAIRPLGAMLFGHIGDKFGRKGALSGALMTMGIATFLIGVLPTYQDIGVGAAVILLVLRTAQGIGLGGAWGGAAVMVAECYPPNRRGYAGSLVQMASPIGLLLGTGVFAIINSLASKEVLLEWAWRIPFLLSILLVVVGLYTQKLVHETPLFKAAEETKEPAVKLPLGKVFRLYWRELLIAVGSRFGSDAVFYIYGLFVLVYGPTVLGVESSVALQAVVLGAVAQLVGIPLFGLASDRFGRRPVLIFGAIACILWGFAFFPLLGTKLAAVFSIACIVGLFLHAALWAPMAAFLSELFGTDVRYSGAAIGFQLAAVVGGAVAPLIATSLVTSFSPVTVSIYIAIILGVCIVTVLAAKETANTKLEDVRPSGGIEKGK